MQCYLQWGLCLFFSQCHTSDGFLTFYSHGISVQSHLQRGSCLFFTASYLGRLFHIMNSEQFVTKQSSMAVMFVFHSVDFWTASHFLSTGQSSTRSIKYRAPRELTHRGAFGLLRHITGLLSAYQSNYVHSHLVVVGVGLIYFGSLNSIAIRILK